MKKKGRTLTHLHKLNNITTDEATHVTGDSNCTDPDSQLDDKDSNKKGRKAIYVHV